MQTYLNNSSADMDRVAECGEHPFPNRQSIRLKGWDYASPGDYFVTINTQGGRPLFGTVVKGRMALNEAGRIAEAEWRKSPDIRPDIALDEFIIMPTHMHGIVRLNGRAALHGREALQGLGAPSPYPQFGRPVAGTLGVFVGAYKAAVSRALHRMGLVHQAQEVWHRNYWDIIVRDQKALDNIRNYIRFNPQNYEVVMQCGEPEYLGNRALLDGPKLGFLASRGEAVPHGHLPLKPGEAVISGFLSPMERAVFKAGLEHRRPLIWVKPWALENGTQTQAIQAALAEERLLILSPFADQNAPSARRAAWCNEYVMHHCDKLVLGHLNPGGMLECLLSDAPPDLEIACL